MVKIPLPLRMFSDTVCEYGALWNTGGNSLRCTVMDTVASADLRGLPWSCATTVIWNANSTLLWRHNGRDAIASLITSLTSVYSTIHVRRRSKKTSKLRVTGLCAGNSPETGEFPAQMASNAKNVSIWWRHHAYSRGLSIYIFLNNLFTPKHITYGNHRNNSLSLWAVQVNPF